MSIPVGCPTAELAERRRDNVQLALAESGIANRVHWDRAIRLPTGRWSTGYQTPDPATRVAARRACALAVIAEYGAAHLMRCVYHSQRGRPEADCLGLAAGYVAMHPGADCGLS